jgi:hypothetical protein
MHKNPTRQNATKILVIASKATGLIRRYIDADNDHEYVHHEKMHEGEIALYIPHEEYDAIENPSEFHHHVARKLGFEKAPDMRHAIVNPSGKVVHLCMADPTCGDSGEHYAKGHKLIKHETAVIGDTI